jgi:hypothetical protein
MVAIPPNAPFGLLGPATALGADMMSTILCSSVYWLLLMVIESDEEPLCISTMSDEVCV